MGGKANLLGRSSLAMFAALGAFGLLSCDVARLPLDSEIILEVGDTAWRVRRYGLRLNDANRRRVDRAEPGDRVHVTDFEVGLNGPDIQIDDVVVTVAEDLLVAEQSAVVANGLSRMATTENLGRYSSHHSRDGRYHLVVHRDGDGARDGFVTVTCTGGPTPEPDFGDRYNCRAVMNLGARVAATGFFSTMQLDEESLDARFREVSEFVSEHYLGDASNGNRDAHVLESGPRPSPG